jgi:uncharacterized membrane protein
MNTLSVAESLRFGWNTFTRKPSLFVAATLIVFGLGMVLGIPQSALAEPLDTFLKIFWTIAFIVAIPLSFLLSLGKLHFYLRAHDSVETANLKDLFHPHSYGKYILATILTGIATIIGFLLFIIPGIIIGLMLCLTPYLVVDHQFSAVHAIKEGARLTKGNRWNLLLLGCALLGINIIGFCALGIGLLITMPISSLALVHAYRTLAAGYTPAVTETAEI